MLGKPSFPTEKPRPAWMDQAEERHPEILDRATVAFYNAVRNPALGVPMMLMDEDKRSKMILDGIYQIYTQMLEAE